MKPREPQPPIGRQHELLDWMFVYQSRLAGPSQRRSVRRWQARDRYYEHVQRAAEGKRDVSDEVLLVLADLQSLARPVAADVQVWRGIRSIRETFGVGISDLTALRDQIIQRLTSTSVDEDVVRGEFVHPGRDAAILKVRAKTGAAAVWIPPIGSPKMRYQGELLFQPGLMLRIVGLDVSAEIPVIEVEVSQP